MRSRFAAHAAKKNRRRQLLARAPRISVAIEAAYVSALRRALKAFHAEILRAYTPQARHDSFATAFSTLAQRAKQAAEAFRATAFQMAKRLEAFSKREAIRTLGDIASDLPAVVNGFAETFSADAVTKLGGIMEESLRDAEEAAIAVAAEEVGTFTIDNILDGWVSRGINSARNMVTQGTAELNQARHEEAGVTDYVWLSQHDATTRPEHAALDGKECSYDDPPLSSSESSSGEDCNPGDDYGCRCMASPIVRMVAEAEDDEAA